MQPLTVLTDDEQMLQNEVRRLAQETVRPLVHDSDRDAKIDPSIVKAFFEMGLMSVEIPEEYGGAGMSFTCAILAVEQLARVDPSAAVVMDVQNTLVNNCILRWGPTSRRNAGSRGSYPERSAPTRCPRRTRARTPLPSGRGRCGRATRSS